MPYRGLTALPPGEVVLQAWLNVHALADLERERIPLKPHQRDYIEALQAEAEAILTAHDMHMHVQELGASPEPGTECSHDLPQQVSIRQAIEHGLWAKTAGHLRRLVREGKVIGRLDPVADLIMVDRYDLAAYRLQCDERQAAA
jgi:hypothetical protein